MPSRIPIQFPGPWKDPMTTRARFQRQYAGCWRYKALHQQVWSTTSSFCTCQIRNRCHQSHLMQVRVSVLDWIQSYRLRAPFERTRGKLHAALRLRNTSVTKGEPWREMNGIDSSISSWIWYVKDSMLPNCSSSILSLDSNRENNDNLFVRISSPS